MGSPMFNWYLRSMGAKVGKGVCALGCNCAELDMVAIGDGTGEAAALGRRRSSSGAAPVLAASCRRCWRCCLPAGVAAPRHPVLTPSSSTPPHPGAVINEQAFLMGHTVENRAVKMGWVT